MVLQGNASIEQKLAILADAAKYDVACTSSGVERPGKKDGIGNTAASGICHSFAADGRCISLLKVLYTNECCFNCKYCINRSSNDVPRASFEPEELCTLVIEFYRRNYIEGLFLSSGILQSPNYTMEQIIYTLKLLRTEYRFHGYIHCKSIPGADPFLVEEAGWYADRMSINLELPTAEGLQKLAPNKTRKTILSPIRQIQSGIAQSQEYLGMMGGNKGAFWHTRRRLEAGGQKRMEANTGLGLPLQRENETGAKAGHISLSMLNQPPAMPSLPAIKTGSAGGLTMMHKYGKERGFVPAGQSTQMIIGATPESDFQLISVAEALYERFDLKRVFYSAFININSDESLPSLPGGPPLLREHRLYQADWLLRYYGFRAQELLSDQQPNFNVFLDPKCNWALGHLDIFPVEVNNADYFTLLRVPGIGMKSASRIIQARKTAHLQFEDLKKIGVVLKRALYFITCSGRMMYPLEIEENFITRQLIGMEKDSLPKILEPGITYRQMSLFDDVSFANSGIAF